MAKRNWRIAPLVGLASFPLVQLSQAAGGGADWSTIMNEIATGYTGYDQQAKEWQTERLAEAYGPIVAGFIISFIMGKVGANRYLPAGINF